MDKLKLRIISIGLLSSMLLSMTSCKLQKENKYKETTSKIYSSSNNIDNITDTHLKELAIELAQKVEEKGFGLPIDNYYQKLSKTTFIKNPKNGFKLGTYNSEENKFTYIENDDETIRHELMHVMLSSYDNASIGEGIVQIFLNELYGYEIDGNEFDASLCKIFCRLLDKEELNKFICGDIEILKNKLASIKPAYSDANQFLIYANNSEVYYRLYKEKVFNEEKNIELTKEYKYAKEYRKVVKERIKIYLYNYYMNMDFKQDPYDRLVEMFEILNIFNYDMFDTGLGEKNEMDYFLENLVYKLCDTYNIDKETLEKADKQAIKKESFKYLDKLDNKKLYSYK